MNRAVICFLRLMKQQFDYLKRNVEKQKSLGVKEVEIVDTQTIAEICPILNCDGYCRRNVLAHTTVLSIRLRVMNGFTEKALKNGAKIEFETQVLAIETENGKVEAVETNKGEIECEKVVLCFRRVGARIGENAGIDLPVEPQKRQIVWAKSAQTNCRKICRW